MSQLGFCHKRFLLRGFFSCTVGANKGLAKGKIFGPLSENCAELTYLNGQGRVKVFDICYCSLLFCPLYLIHISYDLLIDDNILITRYTTQGIREDTSKCVVSYTY